MKKVIPVLIALVLIVIIGAATAGSIVFEKYSYSKEKADLREYFKVSGDKLAIVLQDEVISEKARLIEGTCYLDLNTVHKYFNDWFYVDVNEMLLLYVLPEKQGNGFGNELLRFALAKCENPYITVLDSNKKAIDFYTKRGFLPAEKQQENSGEKKIFERKYVYQKQNL